MPDTTAHETDQAHAKRQTDTRLSGVFVARVWNNEGRDSGLSARLAVHATKESALRWASEQLREATLEAYDTTAGEPDDSWTEDREEGTGYVSLCLSRDEGAELSSFVASVEEA